MNKNKIKEITIENLVLILITFFIKEVKMNQYFNDSFYEYLYKKLIKLKMKMEWGLGRVLESVILNYSVFVQ